MIELFGCFSLGIWALLFGDSLELFDVARTESSVSNAPVKVANGSLPNMLGADVVGV